MLQQPRLGCGRTIERGVNNFHYAFDVLADIIIPDAKNSVTFSFKPSRPLLVAPSIFLFAVLRTIDFNDEASSGAGKIDDDFRLVFGGESEYRAFQAGADDARNSIQHRSNSRVAVARHHA